MFQVARFHSVVILAAMLNRCERLKVLECMRICALVALVPVTVKCRKGLWELKPSVSRWHYALCKLSYLTYCLNAAYKNSRLFHIFFFDKEDQTSVYELVIHLTVAMASALACFWYYTVFIAHADVHLSVVKLTLLPNSGRGESTNPS